MMRLPTQATISTVVDLAQVPAISLKLSGKAQLDLVAVFQELMLFANIAQQET